MEPEGPSTEEEERHRPRHAAGSTSTWGWFVTWGVPALVVVVISAATLVNLFSSDASDPSPSATRSPPVRGVACPELQQAAQQLEAGDHSEFAKIVHAATRTGEAALQRSGEIFGRSEKLALDLAAMLQAGALVREPRVDRLMSRIRAACGELDRWQ